MKFNINDEVRIKLTDEGRERHRAQHDALMNRIPASARFDYRPPVEDSEGWSKWQLWVVMETFGPHTHLGSRNCFDTTIEIPDPK